MTPSTSLPVATAAQPTTTFVLIAARAYSGSTLLAALLGAHPDIATVSEISGRRRETRMDVFRCSCGRLMVDCPFWREVQAGMSERGFADLQLGNFGLNFGGLSPDRLERIRSGSLRWTLLEEARDRIFGMIPGHTARLRETGRRNRAFAETVLELTGSRVFVDASKERMRGRSLMRYLGMDLKVVHLVRDVRGVVDSAVRHAGGPLSVADAARDWASTNRTIARHLDGLEQAHRRVVRYEDLCAAPQAELAALFDFCGVDPSLAAGGGAAQEQHLIGSKRRLVAGWADIRIDERWRSSLSASDLARIADVAGDVAATFYPEAQLDVALPAGGAS